MLNRSSLWVALSGALLFLFDSASSAQAAYNDPPGRVAYLNQSQGTVNYSPAGEDQWLRVVRNRPLIRGDRLWTDRNGRAELQVGSAAVRLGANTSFEILDLNDSIAQIQLSQGMLNLSVRRLQRGQSFEVATPTLAFSINRAGRYRIDVDPNDQQTTVVVWAGSGEAYGENANFPLNAGDAVTFYDSDLRDYELYQLPIEDEFDRYCRERDQRLAQSASLRYVDDDMAGYADLDDYGRWRQVSSYGNVWFPSRVAAGWAPYRDGQWVWQEPWGWTWVDNAPWGFAPSHYGRWVSVSNRWGWIPGPRNVRPIYAPALVAFVGGRDWSLSLSFGGNAAPIGWFPLGPREVYMPSYQTSRDYFTRVNVNNTVINNTVINNYFGDYSSGGYAINETTYANRSISGAITAVPSTVFVSGRSVAQEAMRLDLSAMNSGEITRVAMVAPNLRSVLGPGAAAPAPPSQGGFDREVIARNAPPPDERPFAARERQLQRNPGLALDPRAATSAPGRNPAEQNVRLISEQGEPVNVRESAPRRDGDAQHQAGEPLRPLDRSADIGNGRDRGDERGRGNDRGRDEAQQQGERQRQANAQLHAQEQQQRQAEAQQQAERQRQANAQLHAQEQQQRQAEAQQQAERQRQTNAQLQAQEQQQRQSEAQQQGERQRQADTQRQQQAAIEQLAAEQRAEQQLAAEQLRAERQRAQHERNSAQGEEPQIDEPAPDDRGDRREHPRGKGPHNRKDEGDEQARDEREQRNKDKSAD